MKIKRYFAKDMRQAIRLVREEQGPDAVILSNRRVDGGIEIVAAIDYDAALISRMADEQSSVQASQTRIPAPLHAPAAAVATTGSQATKPNPFMTQPEPATQQPVMPPATTQVVWSQEPSIVAMREELQSLRGMLEGQLSRLSWDRMKQSQPRRAQILERLTRLGLSSVLSRRIADRLNYKGEMVAVWRQALALLSRHIKVTDDDILSQGGVVALVGPTGVGKTTTVAKLAARYTLRHGADKVALVTTDSYRIGATQQLKTFGKIIGAPVHVANNAQELRDVLRSLRHKSLVLIDTAGTSPRDVRLYEQLSMLYKSDIAVRSYAVLSAASQRRSLEEVMQTFKKVDLSGVILTKLDEATGLGEALSVVVQQRLPVAYISDGQRVPEDLHQARSNNLVNRSVQLMRGFAESPSQQQLAGSFGAAAG